MTAPKPTPPWVRVVTVIAVSVVAAVAAIASYVHMHELADKAGEQWRAHLIPLSVDGMLVAASMVMLVRRRAGEKAGALPWIGLVLGLIASLAANVAAAQPTPLSWIVSGWPPLALAISFELLILVTRDRAEPGGDSLGGDQPSTTTTAPLPSEPVLDVAEDQVDDVAEDAAAPAPLAAVLALAPAVAVTEKAEELAARLRVPVELVAEVDRVLADAAERGDRRPGRRKCAQEVGRDPDDYQVRKIWEALA